MKFGEGEVSSTVQVTMNDASDKNHRFSAPLGRLLGKLYKEIIGRKLLQIFTNYSSVQLLSSTASEPEGPGPVEHSYHLD